MNVLIIATEDHARAVAYGEHRRAFGDIVALGSLDAVNDAVDEVVIPAEHPDVQEIAAALKRAGKYVTILGAESNDYLAQQNTADGEADPQGTERTGTHDRVSGRGRRKTESPS